MDAGVSNRNFAEGYPENDSMTETSERTAPENYCLTEGMERAAQNGYSLTGDKRRTPQEMEWKSIQADAAACGQRLDKFLAEALPEYSRSFLQNLAKEGRVLADGVPVKASFRLTGGETLAVEIPAREMPEILPEAIPLDILYEDEDLIVVNKPKGMVVHPAAGHSSGTLVNALMYHCRDHLSGINGVLRPGIVHRIDRDTTGSLIVCKNDNAHRCIAEQLQAHTIHRKYLAIVHGVIREEEGTVDAPIGRHPTDRKKMAVNRKNGKRAVTHYQVLERFAQYTYIACHLETGRTHQIRVHMASLHHPLLGDAVYGPSRCPISGLQGQTLHAQTLGFLHPRTGEYMEFSAPLPEYFEQLLERFRGER